MSDFNIIMFMEEKIELDKFNNTLANYMLMIKNHVGELKEIMEGFG